MGVLMVTNNPLIYNSYHQNSKVEYDDRSSYLDVLSKGLDKILEGYKLVNHPLYSNLRTSETPYRTLLFTESEDFDATSYKLLEQSVEIVTKQLEEKRPPMYKENIYKDYQLIDADLISHMIDGLGFVVYNK